VGRKVLWGKRRPFPSWMRKVDWPNDALNFKRQVPLAECVEIAKRLLAYFIYPPPVLARPGGRLRLRDKAAKKISATARKKAKLKDAQQVIYEQLKTYIAFELAQQLAAYERAGAYRMADSEEYAKSHHDFRVIAGYSRILGEDGNLLARPRIKRSEWTRMMGAFCVYDLFSRLGDTDGESALRSEGVSQVVVLLRQNEMGLSTNHATLSKACMRYRSIAHLLVGLFGAVCGDQNRDDWVKSRMKSTPSLDQLASMLGEHLREGLVRSAKLAEVFSEKSIKGRGGPLLRREYQVKLPDELQVSEWKRPTSFISEEERNIIDALDAERATTARGERLERTRLTSSTARSEKETLLKRWRTSSAAKNTRLNHR
jgi:hypothetical protein